MLKGADLGGNAKMVKYAALMDVDTRALNQVIIAIFIFYFYFILFYFCFYFYFLYFLLVPY